MECVCEAHLAGGVGFVVFIGAEFKRSVAVDKDLICEFDADRIRCIDLDAAELRVAAWLECQESYRREGTGYDNRAGALCFARVTGVQQTRAFG